MAEQPTLVEIAGSNRSAPLRGALPVGKVHSLERFDVTIRVRRQTALTEIAPAALAATVPPALLSF